MNTLAIDLGGTKLAAALVDVDGQLSQRVEAATPASGDPEALTQALAQLITRYRGMADRVAVASTGIIHQGILSALNPDNLGGLNRFPLQECIERLSALPCHLLNDAQAAAWAEYLALTPSGQDMAFITVSTGVGGGLVLNGRLQIGRGAFAGHIGHTWPIRRGHAAAAVAAAASSPLPQGGPSPRRRRTIWSVSMPALFFNGPPRAMPRHSGSSLARLRRSLS